MVQNLRYLQHYQIIKTGAAKVKEFKRSNGLWILPIYGNDFTFLFDLRWPDMCCPPCFPPWQWHMQDMKKSRQRHTCVISRLRIMAASFNSRRLIRQFILREALAVKSYTAAYCNRTGYLHFSFVKVKSNCK